MKHILSISFLLFLAVSTVKSQDISTLKNYKYFNKADSSKLFFRFENLNFIKNNEYDQKQIKGATLLGYIATPKMVYYASSKIRLEAGIRLQKYFGTNRFTNNEPVLSISYQPNNQNSLIIGTLNQNNNHNLSEPLLNPEHFFTDKAENGLQYQHNSKKFNLDTWINWKQFIFAGDPFQEKFTFGINANWLINKQNSQNQISLPLEVLIEHEGGEIDSSPAKMQSMVNIASGLKWKHITKNSRIKSWYIETMAYFFSNTLSKRDFIFKNGFALYPRVGFTTKKSNFNLGYYNPYQFVAPNASLLFNANISKNSYFNERNSLLTANYYYQYNITKGIDLGAKLDVYYRFNNSKIYYATALYLKANLDFFIAKIKQ